MSHQVHSSNPISSPSITSMRQFILVWSGQVISITGSGISDFALGLWVFSQAGSVTQFAFFFLFRSLPVIIFSPLAGYIVDRFNRRTIMVLSDTLAALVTVGVAGLLFTGRFRIEFAYLAAILIALAGCFQQPAYLAAISQLAPSSQLSRANGLVQAGQAIADILAPLLAGILLASIKLEGILLVDFATFLCGLATLLAVRFPPAQTDLTVMGKRETVFSQSLAGWRYVIDIPMLRSLFIYFAVFSYITAMVNPLIPPLILSFSTATILGGILSAAGIGLLLGSLLLTTWGVSSRISTVMLAFGGLLGCGLFTMGLGQNVWLIGAGAFGAHFSFPFVNGLGITILQRSVQNALQGRVFALRKMMMAIVQPLGLLTAGLLADHLFEPVTQWPELIPAGFKNWWGILPGRGIGMIFVLIGLTMAAASLITKIAAPLGKMDQKN